ncbi:MAG TPA: MlaD family protein [Coxiellaceae bacterium]|nr:MAG: hypothetical protein A3E81_06230 [Gammaproteobacteria bacterium RIFCSPHIGHO2_12_FULL_36_30]HLB56854.1 MlaD family protein [Coxiellaceae bacterium]
MQGKVNYTAVGFFVVVLSAFLAITIFWLSTMSGNKHYSTYLVYVHENVTGLSVESPVRFNGVKVGYVQAINLDAHNPKLVKLKLGIAPDVRITTSTYAILNEQGITGVVYVNLKAETETAPLLTATAGEPYPVIPSKPSLLMQLSTVLPEVTKDIQNLSASIAELLDKENQESITSSLKNISQITKVMADNSADFTNTMQSLDNTLANMSEASNHFPETVKQLRKTLSSIQTLTLHMTKATDTIDQTMQNGQAAIHNFSNQVIPSAQQALSHLSQATMSMNQLTDELQRNPSMLVRGKAPEPLGPGE